MPGTPEISLLRAMLTKGLIFSFFFQSHLDVGSDFLFFFISASYFLRPKSFRQALVAGYEFFVKRCEVWLGVFVPTFLFFHEILS